MNDFDYWKIAKWVLIVLLAGFIGQFGKSLAKYFMAKGKELRRKQPLDDQGQSFMPTGTDVPPAVPAPDRDATPSEADGKAARDQAKGQKKALKAMAKLEKKRAKQLEKEEDS